ncbi:phosphoenolpyruvate--protein phosphotransferase [Sinanaerobacter chloroacetimidivorans]|uniref:Phosphoenolpyruvate-protein phosphotransferase n=1 Tax=Sinanaerobacter chloroacetimidivorans TaxID=2818044 RepID=A0A8J7W3N8_9FIRM|nr:phosphoenolpyruvate--protein phosphotransferase [Sinanaerobacter chloroacetimidivorans]MBR0599796.1 phosphoenolpyruvate--protein phosphotransferase [Sinanaerobacter chloroacetimidivorans]
MLRGTGVSPGIVFGKVLIIKNEPLIIKKDKIKNVEIEKSSLLNALENSKEELMKIKEKAMLEMGEEKAAIFDAHLNILQDPELLKNTLTEIETNSINAAYAFQTVAEQFIAIFESMDNEYMKERSADIKDVSDRVVRNILGQKVVELSSLDEEVILVAHDLTPSDTAAMDKKKVKGFLTNLGGRTSHTAIMARTLEIPAIIGLKTITEQVENSDFVVLNGETGDVIINPKKDEIDDFYRRREVYMKNRENLIAMKGRESTTIDGKKVELAGNIGTANDISSLKKHDAEGVGLFRTEFVYIERNALPTEDEQFEEYKKVLEAWNTKPVVVRTMDIGGDKKLPYLGVEEEVNPFLGYRAIRLCLKEKEIFKTQLRALLRASIYGELKIMFPMISSLEELLEAKEVLHGAKLSLDEDNIPYANHIEVGMMIEVPSAAIISDILAKHVDFFSIGTNDLVQYTCAVDRMNEKIHHLYNPLNPAVLRLIKMVIDNGHQAGIWVGMCGEMAGDESMIPLLIGMGLDEFSMSATSILPARKQITSLSYETVKQLVDQVMKMGTVKEIEAFMEKMTNA